MAGTILLVLLAHIDDVVHIVADVVVDGWGLVPRFLLFGVDRSLSLVWCRLCKMVGLGPASSRRRALSLLHRSTLEEGAHFLMGLLSLRG
jgi:hypothetical protein